MSAWPLPLRVARRAYRAVAPVDWDSPWSGSLLTGQEASDAIRRLLEGAAPALVGRLGTSELGCVVNYLAIERRASTIRKASDYVRGRHGAFWWYPGMQQAMRDIAGFFPPTPELLARYAKLVLADLPEVDVLGSWIPSERLVADRIERAAKVRLRDLEPYFHADPWSHALAGRTVLVVHPFEQSIRAQYARRRELFTDDRVLPELELKTLRAVQSAGRNETGFRDWFEAFDHMCEQIAATSFDVAIIGAGAYGLPLAAHVKRLGRQAVHLGGATQYLFGIKARASDENPNVSALYTDAWVRPRDDERPAGYLLVEGGRYW